MEPAASEMPWAILFRKAPASRFDIMDPPLELARDSFKLTAAGLLSTS